MLFRSIEYPKFLPEIGTQIKGRMVSLVRRKPIENACARLVAPKYSFIKETITDLNGEFTFNDIEIPDSTNIWIYGINDNGKDNLKVELYPDKKYPLVSKNIVETMNLYSDDWESRKTETINFNNLIENSQMRNYNLQQIEVRANRIEKPKVPVISKFSYVVPNSLLENKRTQCLNDVLRSSLSGYFESTDVDTGRSNKDGSILETGFRFKYKGHYCKIFIDGMEQPQYMEKFWFENLRNDAIEQIELIDSFSSVSLSSRAASVIYITTRKGSIEKDNQDPSFANKMIRSFQEPIEFYHPIYNLDNIKENKGADKRNTLYWNPDLKFDSNGVAEISFFNSDNAQSFNLIIEGVTDNGKVFTIRK